jgi:hypothetical protein
MDKYHFMCFDLESSSQMCFCNLQVAIEQAYQFIRNSNV